MRILPLLSTGRRLWTRFGLVGGPITVTFTIYAPEITWVEDTSDARPDFDIDLPSGNGGNLDAAADDILHLQYSSDAGANWSDYLSHTLTSGEVAGDEITVAGVSGLANGIYIFRARLERGIYASDWGLSDTVTIDAVVLASGTPIGLLLVLTRAGNPGEPIGLLLALTKAS